MLSRMCYALKKLYEHWSRICQFCSDPALQIKTIHDLDPADLRAHDVRLLILDYDGVLASHGEPTPRADVVELVHKFSDFQIYILSNKPMVERQEFFAARMPNVHFVKATRKKPYPDGVQQIIRTSSIGPQHIMLVDDRLATGIVLAVDMGLQARWVTQPYINLAKRPIRETGFIILRYLERFACKLN